MQRKKTERVEDKVSKTTSSEKVEKKSTAKGSFDLADGVYKGTGTGYAGDITVSVQIKDKQIVAIDILSSSDDAAFFNRAKAVIDRIIEGQTLNVDTVSGATYSSNGIISAVKNALTGEKDSGETGQSQSGGTAAAGSSTSVAQVEDASGYKDGTYYGTGTGFGGTLKVQVDISGGKIAQFKYWKIMMEVNTFQGIFYHQCNYFQSEYECGHRIWSNLQFSRNHSSGARRTQSGGGQQYRQQ